MKKFNYLEWRIQDRLKQLKDSTLRIKATCYNQEEPNWRLLHLKEENSTEARYLHLALGFLRGVPYKDLEPRTRHMPSFASVKKTLSSFTRYSGYGYNANMHSERGKEQYRFNEWMEAALDHLNSQVTDTNLLGYSCYESIAIPNHVERAKRMMRSSVNAAKYEPFCPTAEAEARHRKRQEKKGAQ